MKKILNFFTFMLILNLAGGLGLVGFLLATGRLDKQKSLAIVDLLKYQGTPDNLRDQVNEVLYPTTQPATATAPATQLRLHRKPRPPMARWRHWPPPRNALTLPATPSRQGAASGWKVETRNLLARQKNASKIKRLAITAQITRASPATKNNLMIRSK